MEQLTGLERTAGILKHQPVDRIGIHEHFWSDTLKAYQEQGYIGEFESLEDHFRLDLQEFLPFKMVADMDFRNEIVEETDETVLTRDGNGALLRRHKKHNATPEHVDFYVKSRNEWLELREKLLEPDERRIDFEGYRLARRKAREQNRFFVWSGTNVFELMHPLCGHEHMLAGMALDPEWVMDMAEVYSNLLISLQEILFAREGYPDGVWYYEDMGFKERPFMSPSMYRELLFPAHKKTIDFAHSCKLPVIMHSCGFVEPLLPYMVEAGIDCLQVIEIKAGMDLLRVYKNYGQRIALMGGIDVRVLYSNDRKAIDRELEDKIPFVMQNNGFILHSDHSIPRNVQHDVLMYYFQKGRELGTYPKDW